MRGMSPHEKECAFAACAVRIELAEKRRDRREAREWRNFMREIERAPLEE